MFFVILSVYNECMKEIWPDGSIYLSKSNGKDGWTYRPEFKNWLKEHPQAMSKVVKLIDKIIQIPRAERKGGEQEGDVQVIPFNSPYSDIFKVVVGSDKFFVKRDQERMNISGVPPVGGQVEYYGSAIAKEDLGEDPDVEIIDFQLAYTNRRDYNNRFGYFVSRWEDLETIDKYLTNPDLSSAEKSEIEAKILRVKRLFSAYHDVKPENMFYNPKNKKIVMFDLNILQY